MKLDYSVLNIKPISLIQTIYRKQRSGANRGRKLRLTLQSKNEKVKCTHV